MSKKFNNSYLLIAFALLIGLFLFVKFYKSTKSEKTLKTDIVQIDTAKINKILLYPSSEKGQEVIFTKEGKIWKVSNGKINAETEVNSINSILTQLLELKAKRLASRTKDKWAEYQVNDSTATRIRLFEGSDERLNLYIGKFTYQQVEDPYGGGGRGGVIGTSFVRLANEIEVYAVDGFLTFNFNQPFNKWRNQSLISLNKQDISKLTFRYSGDSSFVLSLVNKKWQIGNQMADSIKVTNFLNSLSKKNGSDFDDTYSPVGNSQYQLTIEGNNMSNITIDAFAKSSNDFVINSSINPKSWFTSDRKGVFKDIYKGKKTFMNTTKK